MATIAQLLVSLALDAGNFHQKLDDATKDVDRFSTQGTSGLSSFGAGAITLLGNVASAALDMATRVGASLLDVGTKAVDSAAQYEGAQNIFQASSGASTEQMAHMSALAIQLGNDMDLPGTSAKDAADAMLALKERGISIEDTFDGVRGVLQLSAAAQIDNKTAAEITANALNSFHLAGSKAAEVADLLAATSSNTGAKVTDLGMGLAQVGSIANSMGLTIDQTTTALGEMAKQGIVGSDAGTSLKSMLTALANPSNEAKNAMDQFGISIYDASGKMKPFPAIIDEFSKLQVGAQVSVRLSADELEKFGKKADAARDTIDKLNAKNTDLTDKMVEQYAQLPKAIEAFDVKRTQAEEDFNDKIADLAHNAADKREDLARTLGEKLSDLASAHEDKLTTIADNGAQKRLNIDASFANKMIDLGETHQSKLEDINASFQDKQLGATEKYHDQLTKLEISYESKVSDIQTKIKDTANAYQNDRIAQAHDFQNAMNAISSNYANRQEDLTEGFQNNETDRKETHQDKLEDIEQNYQDRVTQLRDRLASATTDAQKASLMQQLNDAITVRDEAIRDENVHYDRQENTAARHYAEQQAKLDEAKQRELDAQKAKYIQEEKDAAAAYAKAQAALQLSLKNEAKANDIRREQATEAYTEEQKNIDAQRVNALAKEAKHYAEQQIQAQQVYDRQLIDLTASIAQQQAAENSAYLKNQTQAQTAYDRQLIDVKINLDRQTQATNEAYDKQTRRAQEAFDTSFAALSESVNKRTGEMAKEMLANNAALTKAQTELANYNRIIETHGAHLVTVTQQMAQSTAATIFGSDGIRAYNSVINQGLPVYDALNAKVTSGGQAAVLAKARMDGLTGAQEGFNSTLETLELEAGRPLLEPLRKAYGLLNDAVTLVSGSIKDFTRDVVKPAIEKFNEFAEAFKNSPDKIGFLKTAIADAFTTIQTYITEHLPEWEKQLGKWAQAALDWIEGSGPDILKNVDKYVGKIASAVLKHAPDVLTWFGDYVLKFLSWITTPNPDPNVKTFTSKIGTAITDNIGPISASLLTLAWKFVSWIVTDAIPYLTTEFPKFQKAVGDYIVDLAKKAFADNSVGHNIVAAISNGISDKWNTFKSWVTDTLWSGFITATKNVLGLNGGDTLKNIGKDAVNAFFGGMLNTSLFDDIYKFFDTNVIHRADDLLKGVFPGIGSNMINGMLTGIQNAWANASNVWGNFINSLPEWVRNALGIHSDSTVMYGLGGFIGSGLVNGTLAKVGDLKNAARTLSAAITPEITPPTLNALNTAEQQRTSTRTVSNANVQPNANATTRHDGDIYITVEGSLLTETQFIEKVRRALIQKKLDNGTSGV